MKAACRKLSADYHPDKNPNSDLLGGMSADDRFIWLRKMCDVLVDESQRRIYDRFGSAFMAQTNYAEATQSFFSMFLFHLPHYIGLFILTMINNAGFDRGVSRNVCLLFLLAIFAYEIFSVHGELDWIPAWLAPYTTVAEKVKGIRCAFICIIQVRQILLSSQ